jgi:IPT/TIG domain
MGDLPADPQINGLRCRGSAAAAALALALTIAATAIAPATSFAAKTPEVSSVSPSAGPEAGGTSVVIKGAHFTDVTEVKFGSAKATGVTVKSSVALSATSPAGSGTVDVTVTTPEGTSPITSADHFSYGPTVTGVSPDRGPTKGERSVTITGSELAGASAVDFGSASATSFQVNSENSITAVSPEGSGTVDVTVTTAEGTSPVGPSDQFTYVPPPTVTSVGPSRGPETGETEVTITGTNLGEATEVDFGMSPASFFVNDEGSITAFSPAGAGVVDVTVTTAAGGTSLTSFADQFTYVPLPSVTGVSPETGPSAGGSAVTITGNDLTEATAVDFGSTPATSIVADSENSITAVSPAGTAGETVDVTVTTLGGTSFTSTADRFRYLQTEPLLVKSVSPNNGAFVGGAPVIITGSGFTGATSVDFGSYSAGTFTVNSQHKISAIVPAGTGTVDVTVTTPEGTSPTSSADQFSYVASPPTVTRVVPSEARWGRLVKIKGANIYDATAVHFGSASATLFRVLPGGRTIVAISPLPTAASVDVTVTTPEGTSATGPGDRFTYKLGQAVITGVSPHEAPAAGGTVVSIGGENFVEVTAVDFGSVPAKEFTVNSADSITAVTPAETVGRVDVNVTTPLGGSVQKCKTYYGEEGRTFCQHHEGFKILGPTITSVTPGSGATGGGTPVTISGSGFGTGTAATAFHFGRYPATSVECASSATCTAITPARKAGTVDVRATVPNSGIARSARNPPDDQFTFE